MNQYAVAICYFKQEHNAILSYLVQDIVTAETPEDAIKDLHDVCKEAHYGYSILNKSAVKLEEEKVYQAMQAVEQKECETEFEHEMRNSFNRLEDRIESAKRIYQHLGRQIFWLKIIIGGLLMGVGISIMFK